jgi:hypothetical protein
MGIAGLDVGEGDASARRLDRRTRRGRDGNLVDQQTGAVAREIEEQLRRGSSASATTSNVYLVYPSATLACAKIGTPSQYTVTEVLLASVSPAT